MVAGIADGACVFWTLASRATARLTWAMARTNLAGRDDIDFSALSLTELLRARDAYHVHLLNLDSVVATAVGRYLARDGEEEGAESFAERVKRRPGTSAPRTLENASVREWSWPC